MAHYRRQIGAAALLNTAIFAGEAAAGVHSGSSSLLMDAVHNFSDQVALTSLYVAFVAPVALTRISARAANLLNAVGLIAVSAVLVWQSVERLSHPRPVDETLAVVFGLAAAAGNWGVARLLREPARLNASVRLAYLHNQGDVLVSLAPVVAGLLVGLFGPLFDPLVALVVAAWFIGSTARELVASRADLIWPEAIVCGHG